MKEMIKAQELEAAKDKQRKKEEGAKLLAEVLEANREALREKQLAKQREREEDERILKFMADKAAEEEAWEEEKRQIKIAKDKQFYAVANTIKKSLDNRAEIDAQRAKRHQQQQERKEREAEAARIRRQKETMRELQRARKEQEKGKLEHLKLLALQERRSGTRLRATTKRSTRALRRRSRSAWMPMWSTRRSLPSKCVAASARGRSSKRQSARRARISVEATNYS